MVLLKNKYEIKSKQCTSYDRDIPGRTKHNPTTAEDENYKQIQVGGATYEGKMTSKKITIQFLSSQFYHASSSDLYMISVHRGHKRFSSPPQNVQLMYDSNVSAFSSAAVHMAPLFPDFSWVSAVDPWEASTSKTTFSAPLCRTYGGRSAPGFYPLTTCQNVLLPSDLVAVDLHQPDPNKAPTKIVLETLIKCPERRSRRSEQFIVVMGNR